MRERNGPLSGKGLWRCPMDEGKSPDGTAAAFFEAPYRILHRVRRDHECLIRFPFLTDVPGPVFSFALVFPHKILPACVTEVVYGRIVGIGPNI